jgi:hypothetical protein
VAIIKPSKPKVNPQVALQPKPKFVGKGQPKKGKK